MPEPLLSSRRAISREGRTIHYAAFGRGDQPIVVVSGGVADEVVWRPQLAHLPRHRFLAWTPRLPGAEISLTESLAELESICEEEKVNRPYILGWGGGVRWALEAARSLGGRTRGVALVSGLGGRAFRTLAAVLVPLGPSPELADVPVSAVRRRHRPERLATHPKLVEQLMWRSGVFGAHLEAEAATEIAEGIAAAPLRELLRRALASSSQPALAAAVRVEAPALVLAGDADPLMPAALAQQLGRALPRARVRILRGGAHFVTRELPDYVNLELARFLTQA